MPSIDSTRRQSGPTNQPIIPFAAKRWKLVQPIVNNILCVKQAFVPWRHRGLIRFITSCEYSGDHQSVQFISVESMYFIVAVLIKINHHVNKDRLASLYWSKL